LRPAEHCRLIALFDSSSHIRNLLAIDKSYRLIWMAAAATAAPEALNACRPPMIC
jgi:hypothetical protein